MIAFIIAERKFQIREYIINGIATFLMGEKNDTCVELHDVCEVHEKLEENDWKPQKECLRCLIAADGFLLFRLENGNVFSKELTRAKAISNWGNQKIFGNRERGLKSSKVASIYFTIVSYR